VPLEIVIINTLFFLTALSRVVIFSILGNKEKTIWWSFVYKQSEISEMVKSKQSE
jgi:hypothetical protein